MLNVIFATCRNNYLQNNEQLAAIDYIKRLTVWTKKRNTFERQLVYTLCCCRIPVSSNRLPLEFAWERYFRYFLFSLYRFWILTWKTHAVKKTDKINKTMYVI